MSKKGQTEQRGTPTLIAGERQGLNNTSAPIAGKITTFAAEVRLRGTARLKPDDFSGPSLDVGFCVRFRETLLSSEREYAKLLGANAPPKGILSLTVRVDEQNAEPWYQDADTWLLEAAKIAVQNPTQKAFAPDTAEGVQVDAIFLPAAAKKPLAPGAEARQVKGQQREHGEKRMVEGREQLKSAVQLASRHAPKEFAAQADCFVELGREFRTEIAGLLEKSLNEHLVTAPQNTAEEKQELARSINAKLRQLGLAVKCPKTGRPSTLISDTIDRTRDAGRFRFENRDEHGVKVRSAQVTSLTSIELVEDAPRIEPLADLKNHPRTVRRPRERS